MKRKSIRRPMRKSTKRSPRKFTKRSTKRSPRKSLRRSPIKSTKRSPRKSLRKDSGGKLSEILKNIKQYSKIKKDDNEENIEEENEMLKLLKQILKKLEKEKKPTDKDKGINKNIMKLIKEMEEKEDEIKFQTPKKSSRLFIPMAPKKSPNQNLRMSPRFPELNFEDKNTDTFRLRNVISRLHPLISRNSSNYENPYIFSPFFYEEKEKSEKEKSEKEKSEKSEKENPDKEKLDKEKLDKENPDKEKVEIVPYKVSDNVKSDKDIVAEKFNNAISIPTPTTPPGGKPIPLSPVSLEDIYVDVDISDR